MWIFMAVEMVTFGLFLLNHAWGWRSEPTLYAEGQALLHPASGLRGTVLLLLGSGLAYQGVLAHEQGRNQATALWFATAALAGLLFAINKIIEYTDPALSAVTLSTSTFWFGYLFLTELHLLHVLGGVAVLPWLAVRAWFGQAEPLAIQAGAVYWHLVDVVWVLLFPILYLMHP